MIKDDRLRLLSALGHVVEVLDDLKPCGHSGDEEPGEHDADCMLCRGEAALAPAEEAGCMPPGSAGGMTCPDCDGRGYPVGRSEDKCGFCGGTSHVLRDHK